MLGSMLLRVLVLAGLLLGSLGPGQGRLAQAQDASMRAGAGTGASVAVTTRALLAGVPPLGDVNDDMMVDSTDVLIVLSADAGFNTAQFCPMNCGDVNADGVLDSTDALILLSYDVGMDVPFPVGVPVGCPPLTTQPPGCQL